MGQVRVVVAEDHKLMRGLIREILESDPTIKVVDEAADGVEALDKVKNHQPDVLVLDLQMPVLGGVEVVQSVRAERLPVKVLVLSTYKDPNLIKSVMKCGVAGFVTKDEAQSVLARAVVNIAEDKMDRIS